MIKIEKERPEKGRTKMQQLEVDVRIYGVLFDILDSKGNRQIGIIRKGMPIPTSINELNMPIYRRMKKIERKSFIMSKVHKLK